MHIEENIRGKLRMAEMFEMMASVPPLRNDVFSFSQKKS
jgi:hypothetical protein